MKHGDQAVLLVWAVRTQANAHRQIWIQNRSTITTGKLINISNKDIQVETNTHARTTQAGYLFEVQCTASTSQVM